LGRKKGGKLSDMEYIGAGVLWGVIGKDRARVSGTEGGKQGTEQKSLGGRED